MKNQQQTALWARLAKGGAPAALATALMMMIPLLGRAYLDDQMYAAWSLVASVGTVGLLIDMGAPSLAVRISSTNQATPRRTAVLILISSAPSIIVGIAAAALWPLYSRISDIGGIKYMPLLFCVTAIAGAMRSAVVIFASIALGRELFGSRGVILAGQALFNCVLVWAFLACGLNIVSYPVASLISCCVILAIIGVGWKQKWSENHSRTDTSLGSKHFRFRNELKKFISTRGLASILGLGLTQLDRWVVGAVSTTAFLADYDLAARFAVIPKTAVLTLGLSFVHEAARERGQDRANLLTRLYRTTSIVLICGTLGSILLMLTYFQTLNISRSHVFTILFIILIVSANLNSFTAPGTLILAGMGHPKYELYYLIPASLLAMAGSAYFILHGSAWGVCISISSAIAATSIVYAMLIRRPIVRERNRSHLAHNTAVTRTQEVEHG